MAEENNLDEASKAKGKSKQTEYVCGTKCYWHGRLYREGDVVSISGDVKDLPEYFVKKD